MHGLRWKSIRSFGNSFKNAFLCICSDDRQRSERSASHGWINWFSGDDLHIMKMRPTLTYFWAAACEILCNSDPFYPDVWQATSSFQVNFHHGRFLLNCLLFKSTYSCSEKTGITKYLLRVVIKNLHQFPSVSFEKCNKNYPSEPSP